MARRTKTICWFFPATEDSELPRRNRTFALLMRKNFPRPAGKDSRRQRPRFPAGWLRLPTARIYGVARRPSLLVVQGFPELMQGIFEELT